MRTAQGAEYNRAHHTTNFDFAPFRGSAHSDMALIRRGIMNETRGGDSTATKVPLLIELALSNFNNAKTNEKYFPWSLAKVRREGLFSYCLC
jgi:hypothetical protein